MQMSDALAHLDAGGTMVVRCPDGQERTLWGYNKTTGDLFVTDWPGNVWMRRRSDGQLAADFD
jgi:hypothetical protein